MAKAVAKRTVVKQDTPDIQEEKLSQVKAKIDEIVKEFPTIELGVWLTQKDVEVLFQKFKTDPGIRLYKIDAHLRVD